MPGQFLTKAEREQLSCFPLNPTENDIITFFTLSQKEIALSRKRSGDLNRLVFAIQLGALRYLGFVPDHLRKTPLAIVDYLANQLNLNPKGISSYQQRPNTRTAQLQQIRNFLGWRKPTHLDLLLWENWLLDRAMEHDRPSLLFQLLCQKLKIEKIVRPAITTLERMVMNARSQAHTETFKRLEFLLTSSTRKFLDSLLVMDESIGRIPLSWLRCHAISNSPNAILNSLKKLSFLEAQNISSWNLSGLNPNRIKFLAQLGKKSSNQTLKKMQEEKRYPILVAFVYQIFEEVTDETMDLFIHCLGDVDARARRDLKEFHLNEAKSTNEKVKILKELGQVILDQSVNNEQVRNEIFQKITPESLKAAIEDCQRLMRPDDDNHFDFLANRYSYIRRFAPIFFSFFTFNSNLPSDPLLLAINLLRQLDNDHKRKVPDSAPQDFISAKWANYIFDSKGEIIRRYYEMCLLWKLRQALRSGDVWLERSRRYANPESYLIPKNQWLNFRPEVCQMLQLHLNSEDYRRRINTQLNKGEKLHDLRRFLFFAHQGLIRHQQDENLANQSACLTLVTNAVVAWNTVYMQEVIKQLANEDVEVVETDLIHCSPARFKHINPYGHYEFDVAKTFNRKSLRPLRNSRS